MAKPPEPSPTLVEALKSGQAIAIVGSGLTTAAGGPTWRELLSGVAAEAKATRPDEKLKITSALKEIKGNGYLNAASLLKDVLGSQFSAAVVRQIRYKIKDGKSEPRNLRPQNSHRILTQLNFRSFITTNYDTLLEDAIPLGVELPVYSRSYQYLAHRIQENQRFILKLHGDIFHKEDLVLARSDYPAVQFDHAFRQSLGGLFQSTTPFWIGYGHNDPDLDLLLDQMKQQLGLPGGFAIARKGDPSVEQRFRDSNIYPTFLDSYNQIDEFLENLAIASGVELLVDITIQALWVDQREAEERAMKLAKDLSSLSKGDLTVGTILPGSVKLALRGRAEVIIELKRRLEIADSDLLRILRQHSVVEMNGLRIENLEASRDLAAAVRRVRFSPPKLEADPESMTPTYGRFRVGPYEYGMATTIGNALRRCLLSALEGAAITAINIQGVMHEFSAVPGVQEDVLDIIGNLKRIPIVLRADREKMLVIDAVGPGTVLAGQLSQEPGVEILEPDNYIATLREEGRLMLRVQVKWGRGYVSADQNTDESMGIGWIPLDSSHSPIRRVNYRVEVARVSETTEYERLILEVWTNGSTRPEEAVSLAAMLLKDHLGIFILHEEGDESGREKLEGLDALLAKNIDELDLSVRSANSLKKANIHSLRDLVRRTEKDMLETKNFGQRSLEEIQEVLKTLGLKFGMSEIDDDPIEAIGSVPQG